MKAAGQLLLSVIFGLGFFAAALFLPAGTFDYPQAWIFLVVFSLATGLPTIYLAVKYPAALQRRLHAGPTAETRPAQRLIMSGTLVAVIALYVVSALDHRFGWSTVPAPVVIVGLVMVATGLVVSQLVIVQNNYAAAKITVEEGQTVASGGMYGWVRHPMYVGALIMMVGSPPALDSLWGLAVIPPALILLGLRIVDEEKMLVAGLPGYPEYRDHVRYRMIPYVW